MPSVSGVGVGFREVPADAISVIKVMPFLVSLELRGSCDIRRQIRVNGKAVMVHVVSVKDEIC